MHRGFLLYQSIMLRQLPPTSYHNCWSGTYNKVLGLRAAPIRAYSALMDLDHYLSPREQRTRDGHRHHTRDATVTESLALCLAAERLSDATSALDQYVFWLACDGVTQAEIGAVLGMTASGISRRLSRYRPEADL